jgi:hypothetical protein
MAFFLFLIGKIPDQGKERPIGGDNNQPDHNSSYNQNQWFHSFG